MSLKHFLQKEAAAFKILSSRSRTLLYSYSLLEFTSPLFSIFTNAYIWRQTQGLDGVLLYNLANFLILPLAFYLNGLLLKRFLIRDLYLSATIIKGLGILLLICGGTVNLTGILLWGLISGLGEGLYWANRNYLTYQETEDRHRNYFSSLENGLSTCIGIIAPAFTGLLIGMASGGGPGAVLTGYKNAALAGLLILILTGLLVKRQSFKSPKVKSILLRNASHTWQQLRLLQLVAGLTDGVMLFLPSVLILGMGKDEQNLGLIMSLLAILSAILGYVIGRKSQPSHRWRLLSVSVLATVTGGLALLLLPQPLGGFIYIGFTSVTKVCNWCSLNPLILSYVDTLSDGNDYRYIFDQELALNVGRALGLLLFLVINLSAIQSFPLAIPLILGILEGTGIAIAYRSLKSPLLKQTPEPELHVPGLPL